MFCSWQSDALVALVYICHASDVTNPHRCCCLPNSSRARGNQEDLCTIHLWHFLPFYCASLLTMGVSLCWALKLPHCQQTLGGLSGCQGCPLCTRFVFNGQLEMPNLITELPVAVLFDITAASSKVLWISPAGTAFYSSGRSGCVYFCTVVKRTRHLLAWLISSWQVRSEAGHRRRSLFTLVSASRRSFEDGDLATQQPAYERIPCLACLLSSYVSCALSVCKEVPSCPRIPCLLLECVCPRAGWQQRASCGAGSQCSDCTVRRQV